MFDMGDTNRICMTNGSPMDFHPPSRAARRKAYEHLLSGPAQRS
jgi:hypothetical protein